MRPSVTEAWPAFAAHFEGVCDFLYLDTRALVTTGIGFLMDEGTGHAPEACLKLPWVDQGVPASPTQIGSAWAFVKARTDLAPRGGFAFQGLTTVRLPGQAINALLTAKTLDFWSILSAQLPGLEQWPADAQLALIDMGWNLGPHFLGAKWPNFTAAAHAEDFAGMATHCQTANRSPRDARHVRLFSNAAQVIELGIDPERLWDDEVPKQEEVPVATERLPLYGRLTCIDLIRILPLVEYRFMLKGWIKRNFDGLIFQLTYGPPVAASSNTHVSGAVLDVDFRMVNSDDKIRTWRECGVIMQPRPTGTIRNVQAHGHGCVAGCPHLHPEAQAQVDDYRTHFGNGLVNDRPALGPHVPYITYQNALKKYAALVEEMNMPTAKEIVDEMIKQGPTLGKAIAKGFLSADDIVSAGRTEPDKTNLFWGLRTFFTNGYDAEIDARDDLEKIRVAIEKLAAKP